MNPVLVLTHNCLELTKRMIGSLALQNVACSPFFVDNGSNDGTPGWIISSNLRGIRCKFNEGVSFGWNMGLGTWFDDENCNYVLVINNDVVLPPWFYQELLSYDVPFVSGVSVDNMDMIREPAGRMPLSPSPDFSAFLIRREAWEKVGPFDEKMKFYASDLDWHIRAHRKGFRLLKANCPFFHERSSTLNHASPQEAQVIREQADCDRATLFTKWGCTAWGPTYDKMFSEETFGANK